MTLKAVVRRKISGVFSQLHTSLAASRAELISNYKDAENFGVRKFSGALVSQEKIISEAKNSLIKALEDTPLGRTGRGPVHAPKPTTAAYQDLFHSREETRSGALVSIWKYIRDNGLQNEGAIALDAKLSKVFGLSSGTTLKTKEIMKYVSASFQ